MFMKRVGVLLAYMPSVHSTIPPTPLLADMA